MTQALTDRSRTLLNAMGIDVYRLRHGDAGEALPAAETERARQPAGKLKDALPPVPLPGAAAPVTPAAPAPGSEPGLTGTRVDAGPAIAPFTVLCLRKAGGLVIMEADAAGSPRQKAERRFAVDLLAAATGAWGGDSEAVAFDWPQAAIDNTAHAQQKALGAFLAKQLSDAEATVVLMDEGLTARLPEGRVPGHAEAAVLVPPLTAVMSDAALKRRLWQTLERYGAE